MLVGAKRVTVDEFVGLCRAVRLIPADVITEALAHPMREPAAGPAQVIPFKPRGESIGRGLPPSGSELLGREDVAAMEDDSHPDDQE